MLSNGSRIGNYTFGNYGVTKGLKTGLGSGGGVGVGTMGSPESKHRVLTAEEEEIAKKMGELLRLGSPGGGGEEGDRPFPLPFFPLLCYVMTIPFPFYPFYAVTAFFHRCDNLSLDSPSLII